MRAEPLPPADAPVVRLLIDNLEVSAPVGISVLHAAERAGIFIPSLCAHKELSPFGSCRLCAVHIDGAPGFPLACSTPVAEGMRVTTDSADLRRRRRAVLELILSQHPSSCLICGEKASCRRSQETIHKAGVATGCHSCTNDGACELQLVVDRLGLRDITVPITYRGLEPELEEPFYDRDYNLCILCGRCVRMCQEVRGSAVLAFKFRGPQTLIGPAFGESHLEAGCEFCGACVSVCPTGALAERVSKWDGAPDQRITSTCPFCFLGCQLELWRTGGRLSSARGAPDEEINDGQLCVRGAFCLPEATHHFSRARKPTVRQGPYDRVASWDEALEAAAAQLREVRPEEFLMLVSADLGNEGLYAAQRFVRAGLGSAGIDSTDVSSLPGGPERWSRLFALPVSMRAVTEADGVIVAGLDSRFSFSVVGVQVRRALRRGAALITVDARESNPALMADQWLRCRPAEEAHTLSALLRGMADAAPAAGAVYAAAAASGSDEPQRGLGVTGRELADASAALRGTRKLAIVVGPRVFDCPGAARLVEDLEETARRPGTTVVPLMWGANIRGALELGVGSGLLPGPRWAESTDGPEHLSLQALRAGRRPKLLYLVGEAPWPTRPDCDVVIAQDLYPPPFPVDVFLPAASFAEAGATLTNLEGRVQEVCGIEDPAAHAVPGDPWPDWRIFAELARRLGRQDVLPDSAAAVRAAIHTELPDFPPEADRRPRRMHPLPDRPQAAPPPAQTGDAAPAAAQRRDAAAPAAEPGSEGAPAAAEADDEAAPAGRGRFLLVFERPGFRHRGIDLSGVVEGLAELRLEEGLRMSPADIERLGVCPNDMLVVTVETPERLRFSVPVRPDPACPPRTAYLTRVQTWGGLSGRRGLEPLSRLPARPMRARIAPAARAPGPGARSAATTCAVRSMDGR